jgi:hypothetical protein
MYFIMKLTNFEQRAAVVVNGLLMWASFLFCRVLFNPAIVLSAYLGMRPDILAISPVMIPAMYTLFFALQAINVWWFYKVRPRAWRSLSSPAFLAPAMDPVASVCGSAGAGVRVCL